MPLPEKDRIKQLEDQVKELMDWKRKKERQQITFPLDKVSTDILNNKLD